MKTALVLAISVVISVSLATGQCPNSTWTRLGNKCYFVKRKEADLYENIALCNQLNASMVSITSEQENFQLTGLFDKYHPSDHHFWLGLGQRPNDSKEYYWFDGSPFVYESWMEEPNITYKYFGAYFREGDWIAGSALMVHLQVCSLDLTLKASSRKSPIPAEFRGQCPSTSWRRQGSKCIYFDETKEMTYMENQALCKRLNATMVSIHSEEEHNHLRRLSRYMQFWIGLKQISRKDRLYAWEDGSPKAYENWAQGYPRHLGKKYWAAYSYSGRWYDTYTSYQKYPCCQTFLFINAEQVSTKIPSYTAKSLNSTVRSFDRISKNTESHSDEVTKSIMELPSTTSTYDETTTASEPEMTTSLKENVIRVTGQCPNSTWIQRGNKCYFVKMEKADLYENIALCNQLNASLVSIVNEQENNEVSQIADDFWLGLRREPKASTDFSWFDGRPFDYDKLSFSEVANPYHKYFAAFFLRALWRVYPPYAFDKHYQMCSVKLKQSTPFRKTPNPVEIKEFLVSGQCPNSTWIRRGNKCYFLKREEGDFYQNIALCNQLNASLVSIVNEKENIEVARLTSTDSTRFGLSLDSKPNTSAASRPFWLGISHKVNASKDFHWFDGSPFEYKSWYKEPDYKNYKYWAVYFDDGIWKWFKTSAFYKFYQMCSINLKTRTSYKKTPNPAESKETQVSKQCPNSTWIRRGNKCYFIKREKADFYENIAFCNNLNASLVSIASEAENIQVSRLISSHYTRLWLGIGQKPNASKDFFWFDGSPLVFNSWESEPEVNSKYFGAFIVNGEWFIDKASSRYPQVCSLNLKFNLSVKNTPIPTDLRETKGHCANKTWKRIGNKCIFFNTTKAITYMDNQALCKQLNATMVSIHSQAENIQLSRLFPSKSFWIGIKQKFNSDRLYEWEDGSSVTYESWSNGYPRHLIPTILSTAGVFSYEGQWSSFPKDYFRYPCCQIYLATDGKQDSSKSTSDAASQLPTTARSFDAVSKKH